MRVLVLGASGMLGFAVHRALTDSALDVVGTVRTNTPPSSPWCVGLKYMTDAAVDTYSAVRDVVRESGAELVINAIVKKNVDGGDDVREIIQINSILPHQLADITAHYGKRLIHISTDGVFSGNKGPYAETDFPDAEDIYGVSKFLGEPGQDHVLVLRTSLLGRSLVGTGTLVDWLLSQSGRVQGYRRVLFTGLPVNELARLLESRILPRLDTLRGLYHLSAQPISKYELLRLICAAWGRDDIEVWPTDDPVSDRRLDSSRIAELIDYTPPMWSALVNSMREFYGSLEK